MNSDDVLQTLKEARRVSRQQVCILEWPYREGIIGPPLAHRLRPEDLNEKFLEAGFREWKSTNLSNTIFYRLKK